MILASIYIRIFNISDRDFNKFVDSGEVSDSIIKCIAYKIMLRKTLSQKEMAIFTNKATKINNFIIKNMETPLPKQKTLN